MLELRVVSIVLRVRQISLIGAIIRSTQHFFEVVNILISSPNMIAGRGCLYNSGYVNITELSLQVVSMDFWSVPDSEDFCTDLGAGPKRPHCRLSNVGLDVIGVQIIFTPNSCDLSEVSVLSAEAFRLSDNPTHLRSMLSQCYAICLLGNHIAKGLVLEV